MCAKMSGGMLGIDSELVPKEAIVTKSSPQSSKSITAAQCLMNLFHVSNATAHANNRMLERRRTFSFRDDAMIDHRIDFTRDRFQFGLISQLIAFVSKECWLPICSTGKSLVTDQ